MSANANESLRAILRYNGGAAFPTFSAVSRCDKGGMTLRDYFAAKALQGILANPYYAQQAENLGCDADFAKAAYYHADAMLAARGAP